jgi:hypothetical protein
VFEWLKGLPGFDAHVYTRQLLAGTVLGTRFARDESFRTAYTLFDEHIRDAQTRMANCVVRPRLMATNGAPGSGKSFLLDELAAFRPKDVNAFASLKSRSFFHASNVLALNVTFNSDTSFNSNFDTSAQQSLSLRVLFQYVSSSGVVVSFVVASAKSFIVCQCNALTVSCFLQLQSGISGH